MEALRKHGVEETYVKVSKDIYKESTAIIKATEDQQESTNTERCQTRRRYFS